MTEQIKKTNFITVAGPLLLIIFIDSMGLGLLFPILNALIMEPQIGFGNLLSTDYARNLLYGITIAIYMICWFFGAALLGDLSDQIGRRKSLLICLFGTFGGYLLSAIAVKTHSISLLLLGRVIAGFTAGSQPIAQAAIVDVSQPEHKAYNLGMASLSSSLGFICGPLLGGVLSDSLLIPKVTFATPFYFTSALSFINALLLMWLFKETYRPAKPLNLKLHRAIEVFVSAFKHARVRRLSAIYLIMIIGWSSFYSFISLFLFRIYAFSPLQISLFMAVMGIGFGIGNGILVKLLIGRFSLKANVTVSLLITAICAFMIVAAPYSIFTWLFITILGSTIALAYTALLTLFSNQVAANAQGWVMGITSSMMALVYGIDGFVVALLADFSAKAPILIAVIGLSAAALSMQCGYKNSAASDRVFS